MTRHHAVRLALLAGLALALPGCVVAAVTGAAIGVAKTAASAAGTVVETAVDATTQTQQEADEDRGRALRLEEESAAKEAGRNGRDAAATAGDEAEAARRAQPQPDRE